MLRISQKEHPKPNTIIIIISSSTYPAYILDTSFTVLYLAISKTAAKNSDFESEYVKPDRKVSYWRLDSNY